MPQNPKNPNLKYTMSDCKNWPSLKRGILKGCKEEGWLQEEIRLYLNEKAKIGDTVYYRWKYEEPEFKESIDLALLYSFTWWMKKLKSQIDQRYFQAAPWSKVMQNAFGWSSEKVENIERRIHAVKNDIDAKTEEEKMEYIVRDLLNDDNE